MVLYLGSKPSELYVALEFSTAKHKCTIKILQERFALRMSQYVLFSFSLNQIINIMSYIDMQVSTYFPNYTRGC
jgi:hypothetical protein